VAVLSYGYWQSAFGGEPGVVGKTIHLQGFPFTIVGVAEPSFSRLTPGYTYDVWVPLAVRPRLEKYWTPAQDDAGSWWMVAVGRLKPGISRAAAEGVVGRLFYNEMLHGDKPLFKAEDAPALQLLPANTGLTGVRRKLSTPLYVLMLAVGIVLLIACANVAGLMLARSSGRQKEIAVRLALGASRGRIVRQLLTESVAISVAGGALGIVLAMWSARGLLGILATMLERPTGFSAEVDLRVLAFTLMASIATGILFGLAPALSSRRLDLTPALKDGGERTPRGNRPHGWFNSGGVLVVAQVALTVVMLVGAGLLVHTLESLRRVDPGFETENLLTFSVDPTLTGYKGEQIGVFFRGLREQFAAIPGVTSASYSMVPLLSGSLRSTGFRLHGNPAEKESDADSLPVGPGFFETLRMPLVAGRDFSPAEFEAAGSKPGARCSRASDAKLPVAAIVNESFVRAYFPGQNPIGQRFGGGEDPEAGPDACPDAGWQIVGVVRDARYRSLREDIHPTIYEPSGEGGAFELRTASGPRAAIAAVRDVLKRSGFALPIYEVKS
jgi:predicted permease